MLIQSLLITALACFGAQSTDDLQLMAEQSRADVIATEQAIQTQLRTWMVEEDFKREAIRRFDLVIDTHAHGTLTQCQQANQRAQLECVISHNDDYLRTLQSIEQMIAEDERMLATTQMPVQ